MTFARVRHVAALVATVALAGACSSGPILANAPAERGVGPAPVPSPSPHRDPVPVVLPHDDAPHDRLTEWWYYTGHLRDETGGRWGFEDVVFRAERGDFPVTWASHLALTDERGNRFLYAQRSEIGPQVSDAGDEAGFSFDLPDPAEHDGAGGAHWVMAGGGGQDRLTAAFSGAEARAAGVSSAGLDLALAASKPTVLHDNDGWVDFGPAGGSYYYSRTSMRATGMLTVDGKRLAVDGTAWFDHQWGDFIAVGGGGWDWFAVNLDDRTDLTLSLVRARDGSYPLVYGTLVDADGRSRHLGGDDFTVRVEGSWTSPTTGTRYPAGWTVSIPAERLTIRLRPTVSGQELDTRATTGVVYWEGSQVVTAERGGRPMGGEGYVELTGYGPAG